MDIIKSKGFLVGLTVFLLVAIPLTTYLVLNSEQAASEPQAATVCEANCVSDDPQNNNTELKEDLNSDGLVNGADLALVLTAYGKKGSIPEDLNKDGTVDESDVTLLKAKWSN